MNRPSTQAATAAQGNGEAGKSYPPATNSDCEHISKLHAGQGQPLDPKPADVSRLVSGISDLMRRTIGEQIAVETVLAGGLWRANTDSNQLEIAILNLAVNARDAMPEGGKLTIETSNTLLDEGYAAAQAEVVPGQYVMLAVSDRGTGMSRETLAKVFEPFFTTKDIGHGTIGGNGHAQGPR